MYIIHTSYLLLFCVCAGRLLCWQLWGVTLTVFTSCWRKEPMLTLWTKMASLHYTEPYVNCVLSLSLRDVLYSRRYSSSVTFWSPPFRPCWTVKTVSLLCWNTEPLLCAETLREERHCTSQPPVDTLAYCTVYSKLRWKLTLWTPCWTTVATRPPTGPPTKVHRLCKDIQALFLLKNIYNVYSVIQ